jgi:hypothetical protein
MKFFGNPPPHFAKCIMQTVYIKQKSGSSLVFPLSHSTITVYDNDLAWHLLAMPETLRLAYSYLCVERSLRTDFSTSTSIRSCVIVIPDSNASQILSRGTLFLWLFVKKRTFVPKANSPNPDKKSVSSPMKDYQSCQTFYGSSDCPSIAVHLPKLSVRIESLSVHLLQNLVLMVTPFSDANHIAAFNSRRMDFR